MFLNILNRERKDDNGVRSIYAFPPTEQHKTDSRRRCPRLFVFQSLTTFRFATSQVAIKYNT